MQRLSGLVLVLGLIALTFMAPQSALAEAPEQSSPSLPPSHKLWCGTTIGMGANLFPKIAGGSTGYGTMGCEANVNNKYLYPVINLLYSRNTMDEKTKNGFATWGGYAGVVLALPINSNGWSWFSEAIGGFLYVEQYANRGQVGYDLYQMELINSYGRPIIGGRTGIEYQFPNRDAFWRLGGFCNGIIGSHISHCGGSVAFQIAIPGL